MHFDITELYARRFRKYISEQSFKIKAFKKDIDKAFKKLIKDSSAMQTQYEVETGNGIIKEKQIEWIDRIKSELEDLEDFANPRVKLTFIS